MSGKFVTCSVRQRDNTHCDAGSDREINIIRNSRLTTEWSNVDRLTLSIAQKAVLTMINYNGIGDLYRMYMVTQRAGASFNLAYIGDDFNAEHKEDFDQVYVRALYHYAYEKAERGYPRERAPPGLAGKGH